MNFFGFFSIKREVKRRGHVGEPFAHPLIAIRTESNRVSPPLVGDFVRRHNLPVPAVAPVHAKLMAHRRIEVIADRNPDQLGPRLAEVARGLLRELQVFEQRWPKVVGVKLDCEFAFGQGFLIEASCAHRAQRHLRMSASPRWAGHLHWPRAAALAPNWAIPDWQKTARHTQVFRAFLPRS